MWDNRILLGGEQLHLDLELDSYRQRRSFLQQTKGKLWKYQTSYRQAPLQILLEVSSLPCREIMHVKSDYCCGRLVAYVLLNRNLLLQYDCQFNNYGEQAQVRSVVYSVLVASTGYTLSSTLHVYSTLLWIVTHELKF